MKLFSGKNPFSVQKEDYAPSIKPFRCVMKSNPYHNADGTFGSKDSAGSSDERPSTARGKPHHDLPDEHRDKLYQVAESGYSAKELSRAEKRMAADYAKAKAEGRPFDPEFPGEYDWYLSGQED